MTHERTDQDRLDWLILIRAKGLIFLFGRSRSEKRSWIVKITVEMTFDSLTFLRAKGLDLAVLPKQDKAHEQKPDRSRSTQHEKRLISVGPVV